ncbi:MAG: hypothetical protein R3F29_03385 [Planctomycetota bacterium]
MRSSAAPILVVVAAVAANLLTRGGRDGEPSPEPAAVPAVTVDEAAPAPANGTVEPAPAAAAAPRDHARDLQLPDGTLVPALNGAVDAAPLKDYWGPFPWSPIVGVERSSAGVDWYRHQDGSYSTTQMVWRSDLGREAAMTRVAHPGPEEVPAAGGGAAGR